MRNTIRWGTCVMAIALVAPSVSWAKAIRLTPYEEKVAAVIDVTFTQPMREGLAGADNDTARKWSMMRKEMMKSMGVAEGEAVPVAAIIFAKIYRMSEITEADLDELLRFYATPSGKRLAGLLGTFLGNAERFQKVMGEAGRDRRLPKEVQKTLRAFTEKKKPRNPFLP